MTADVRSAADVQVLLVGVGSYDAGTDMKLPGAVESVVQFRRWLCSEGVAVTPDHVQLLVSPLREDANLLEGLPHADATFDELYAALERIESSGSKTLILVWAGHGVLDGN